RDVEVDEADQRRAREARAAVLEVAGDLDALGEREARAARLEAPRGEDRREKELGRLAAAVARDEQAAARAEPRGDPAGRLGVEQLADRPEARARRLGDEVLPQRAPHRSADAREVVVEGGRRRVRVEGLVGAEREDLELRLEAALLVELVDEARRGRRRLRRRERPQDRDRLLDPSERAELRRQRDAVAAGARTHEALGALEGSRVGADLAQRREAVALEGERRGHVAARDQQPAALRSVARLEIGTVAEQRERRLRLAEHRVRP